MAKSKKKYRTVEDKITNGEDWDLHIRIDHSVAIKIVDEQKKSTPGTEYQFLINRALKKAYKIK